MEGSRQFRWQLLFAVLVAATLIGGCACTETVEAGIEEIGDAAEETAELPVDGFSIDDRIADNGYGDVTIGRTLVELENQYGRSVFQEVDEHGPVQILTPVVLPQLRLSFERGVLRRVDVTGSGISSINGEHQVGEPIESVVDRYRSRIANGERLTVTCSDDAVVARARRAFRLAFFHDAGVVTRISSLDRGQLADGGPCPDVDGPVIDNVIVEPEPDEQVFAVDYFVPDRVGPSDILVRNPSTDLLDDTYAAVWQTAAFYFKTIEVIDMVDTVVTCLYDGDPPAVAAAVYRGGELVVAVAIDHIATIENATCAITEIIISFACPTCSMLGPSVDGYIAEIDGVTYAVAYGGVFTRSGMLESMCRDLPHCPDVEFTEVPDSMLIPRSP